MLIVADENMPQVRESFAAHGEVRTLPGRALSAADVRDADILLVRSVTKVDRALLDGSRVRFVGSATIGTDHIDTAYLQERGIAYASAPGCNATAVVEYVLSCLSALDGVLERLFSGGIVGVIGLGNVGSRLVARLQRLGIRCIGYDPLLATDMNLPLCDLEQVLRADVVCCHTPLTYAGAYPTFHQLDAERLQQLPAKSVLLNAGRGAAIDSAALQRLLAARADLRVVLDVWEQEPQLERELLARVALGTPHIAGYSTDGKLAGTRQIVAACYRFFGWPLPPAPAPDTGPRISIDDDLSGVALVRAAVQAAYDVRVDDRVLRAALRDIAPECIANEFDRLRKSYPARREFAALQIDNWSELCMQNRSLLLALGFKAPVR
ncbi:MAG TPA: 4-phosphoerythronate dehydrogenase [Spongiibacteraceae bacterium]|nr:4-phosphoerythronate dehydrogenase [Spongiibacteraceae bacterium]